MSVIAKIKNPASSSWLNEWIRRTRHGDVIFRAFTILAAVTILITFLWIGYVLWDASTLSRDKFGLGFLFSIEWDPVKQDFGALPFIYGTIVTSLLALILAVPIGVGVAIFLAELAPDWIRQPVGYLIELLAAVPSVIFGLWGLYALIPLFVRPASDFLAGSLGFIPIFAGPVLGPSRFGASVVLTIMILPTISALCRDVFAAIPSSQREAALALGATKWEMISQVLIPYGMSGILGAVILGLGRALGETIAVTMLIGNNRDLTVSILHPGYTMASIIANEFAEATDEMHRQALIEIGLILFALTLALNMIARLLVWRVARKTPSEVTRMTTQAIAQKPSLTLAAHPARYRWRQFVNRFMLFLCGFAALIAVIPLIWIVVYVTREGAQYLSIDFFTHEPTPVGIPGGGVVNAIIGSGIVVGIACLIAIPIGIIAAFYSAENPNTPLGIAVRFGTDVLSGVPSIVMGMFAYAIVVLPQRHFSALSGGIALAIIMTPIVLRTTEEMLKLVPRNLHEASLALGASDWKTTLQVMLPAAINGVVTGVMLGIARVAGEAAPMIFTTFGNPNLSTDLDQPIATLPHMIYVYAIAPYKDWHDKAWTTAFVLIALVLGLNIAARLFTSWRLKKMGWH